MGYQRVSEVLKAQNSKMTVKHNKNLKNYYQNPKKYLQNEEMSYQISKS